MSHPPDEPQRANDPEEPAGPGTGSEPTVRAGGSPPSEPGTGSEPTVRTNARPPGGSGAGSQPTVWGAGSPGTGPQPPVYGSGSPPEPGTGPQPAVWGQQPSPWGSPQPPWSYQPQGPPPPAPPGWRPGGPPPAGPAQSPPPAERDRLAIHLIWEGVLAVIALALIIATLSMTPHQNLTVSLDRAGYIGLVAVGLAFSLRTGTPNLAVGSIVTLTCVTGADLIVRHHMGKAPALIVAVLVATVIGLVLGFVIALLSVPAWAVTLGAATLIQAIAFKIVNFQTIPVRFGEYPTAFWFGLFAILSAGGGALWLLPAVRRPLSVLRRSGEPSEWVGLQSGMAAIVGLTGSSFLAGLAAVPLLMRVHGADPVSGTDATAIAFAAVLFGGVSVFGRRAGIFGTLLGVTILAIVQTLIIYNGASSWVSSLVFGIAALAGLGVSRALESLTGALNQRRPSGPVTAPQAGSPRPPAPPGPPPLPPAPQTP